MNILAIVTEISDPRFSTEEMEASKLKCEFNHEITGLYYDDALKGFPSYALGFIIPPNGNRPIPAHWSKTGQCTMDGVKSPWFDMQRPTPAQIDSHRNTLESASLMILGILICILF